MKMSPNTMYGLGADGGYGLDTIPSFVFVDVYCTSIRLTPSCSFPYLCMLYKLGVTNLLSAD
jgi:hypothetical protein